MGAVGEPGAGIAMKAELAHELSERRLLKGEQNIIKDVEWGLHG